MLTIQYGDDRDLDNYYNNGDNLNRDNNRELW